MLSQKGEKQCGMVFRSHSDLISLKPSNESRSHRAQKNSCRVWLLALSRKFSSHFARVTFGGYALRERDEVISIISIEIRVMFFHLLVRIGRTGDSVFGTDGLEETDLRGSVRLIVAMWII